MDETNSFSMSPPDLLKMGRLFPENYQVESYLGAGTYGQVMRCLKKDTNKTVAVKVPRCNFGILDELIVLKYLKSSNLDEYNIVRFIETFPMEDKRVALVFENLDITLHDYIFVKGDYNCLYVHEVRSVIQQMATALNLLKSKSLIHSDIKPDNILLVDEQAQPIRVKLIDFGLAIPSCKAEIDTTYPVAAYRAPEMYLGLPFTEAIDMWALGITMATMLFGIELISGDTKYDRMRRLVGLFGVPPDHLLNVGLYTHNYFTKTSSGHWRLKTPREYWGRKVTKDEKASFIFESLDELETLSVVSLDMVEADERKECIDLMKAMLQIDPHERITPCEVLNHPFITRGTVQHSSDSNDSSGFQGSISSSSSRRVQSAPPNLCQEDEDDEQQTCSNDSSGFQGSISSSSSSRCVQSALPDFCQEDEDDEQQTCSNDSCGFQGSTSSSSSPCVIFVQSAPPDFCQKDEDDEQQTCSNDSSGFQGSISSSSSRRVQSAPPNLCQEDEDDEQQTCSNDSSGFQGSISSSSSRCVQSALPDFCQEDEDDEQQTCSNDSCGFQGSTSSSSSPRVIFVQSAPPNLCQEDEDDEQQTCSNGSSGSYEPIPASSSPRVIFVQPAPPDCCWDLVEDNDLQSESCSTNKLKDASEDNSDSPRRVFLVKSCTSEPSATTSDHTDPEKKKKNCFKRFFSWMRKTVCSCIARNGDQD